ncbi:hypothetical protein CY35_18G034500 [Sphagnum magellanicum]|nr:hypothetical protein CY35_18G034500 [Sphagnum magellanicum]
MCRISSWTHLLRRTFVNTSSQTPTTTQSLSIAPSFGEPKCQSHGDEEMRVLLSPPQKKLSRVDY